ncbi:peptide chain release factor N(5)-glutamine methyltransferase [Swaminathania salitolerans]|uniref:Release factor glutamine methyltransferase n=1 Tax=Swaminathania salitolerans TaxID=182838 RepID=A0A511BVP1_9PROT|nr:peptide chain release factor N(5)-glutamine methyltransferase [Swaminathania salitolerans]GBQ10629.1 modification methylase HemK [Swaminathania salitolerans LMG 21291]GEL02108.1 release factor glutamine methyltransferase [Swaminathania salitolerans]
MSGNPYGVREVLQEATRRLAEAGLEGPRMEARRLLRWATGCDAASLLTRDELTGPELSRMQDGLARRCARVPLALIEGEAEFWTLTLRVSAATLIPRGDSETVIDTLLALRPVRSAPFAFLDLGTGTGCLLLAALSEYRNATGVGLDLSPEAAALARENARLNELDDRASFVAGNWFAPLEGRFDIVLSNPPYIRIADMDDLMPEVRDHEPHRALVAGEDGLDAYREILSGAGRFLAAGGLLVFEIGIGQEDDLVLLAAGAGFVCVAMRRDLGGIVRALAFERKI